MLRQGHPAPPALNCPFSTESCTVTHPAGRERKPHWRTPPARSLTLIGYTTTRDVIHGQLCCLLGKGPTSAASTIAEQAPNTQVDDDRTAAQGGIGQVPPVAAADSPIRRTAIRTGHGRSVPGPSDNQYLLLPHPHRGQVREELLQHPSRDRSVLPPRPAHHRHSTDRACQPSMTLRHRFMKILTEPLDGATATRARIRHGRIPVVRVRGRSRRSSVAARSVTGSEGPSG